MCRQDAVGHNRGSSRRLHDRVLGREFAAPRQRQRGPPAQPRTAAHERADVDPRAERRRVVLDRREHQRRVQRDLPRRDVAERDSRGHQARGERGEERSDAQPRRVGVGDRHVHEQVAGDEHDPDRHRHELHLLLAGDQRAGRGERERVQHEPGEKPGEERRQQRPHGRRDRRAGTVALAISPAPTATESWPRPTSPMPITFPASSCVGRTAASSSSAVREVFSCVMPPATAAP